MSELSTYEECVSILEDKKKLTYNDLVNKWTTFKLRYPRLYDMLTLTENVDLNMLKYLCETAEKQNKLTENEKFESDFTVGDNLAKKFIYNNFPEPSSKQKEIIKDTLRKKFEETNKKEVDIRDISKKIDIKES